MVSLDKGLQQENVKQKPFRQIQVYSCIFQHIEAYSDIVKLSVIFTNYSGIFKTLCNPGIFSTLVYSKLWYIQNQNNIQNSHSFTKYLRLTLIFHVTQRTTGKLQSLFIKSFLLVLTKFLFWQGDHHSINFRHFSDMS